MRRMASGQGQTLISGANKPLWLILCHHDAPNPCYALLSVQKEGTMWRRRRGPGLIGLIILILVIIFVLRALGGLSS